MGGLFSLASDLLVFTQEFPVDPGSKPQPIVSGFGDQGRNQSLLWIRCGCQDATPRAVSFAAPRFDGEGPDRRMPAE